MVWLDGAIPTEISSGVRIVAREGGVVTTGNAIIAVVLPINIPSVDSASIGIGYFYDGRKSVVPLVGNYILATSVSLGG